MGDPDNPVTEAPKSCVCPKCARPVAAPGLLCLWHQDGIDASAPYVADLFVAQIATDPKADDFRLRGLVLADADLGGVSLQNADLRDAILPRAKLAGCNLSGAKLQRANLQHADLTGADLSGADLSGTHLGNADLQGANLQGAKLDGTILLAADLRGANLDKAVIDGVTWNRFSRLGATSGTPDPSSSAFPPEDWSLEAELPSQAPLAGYPWENAATRRLKAIRAIQEPSVSKIQETHGVESHEAKSGTRQTLPQTANLAKSGSTALETNKNPENEATVHMQAAKEASAPLPQHNVVHPKTFSRPAKSRFPAPLRAAALLALATWAILATAAAIFGRSTQETQQNTMQTTTPDHQREVVEQQLSAYRTELARVGAVLTERETEIRRLTDLWENTTRKLAVSESSSSRLQGVDDENDVLRANLASLKARINTFSANDRRLKETASIMAEGVERLQSDNARLVSESERQKARTAEESKLKERLAQIEHEATTLRKELTQERERRELVTQTLTVTEGNLQRFMTRISGTEIGALLTGEEKGGTIVHLKPGKTAVLGGSALITLVAEQAEQAGYIRLRLTMQPTAGPVPELAMILQNKEGRSLRRMTFSFPPGARPGPQASNLDLTISCPEFPHSVRLGIAQSIEVAENASAKPTTSHH